GARRAGELLGAETGSDGPAPLLPAVLTGEPCHGCQAAQRVREGQSTEGRLLPARVLGVPTVQPEVVAAAAGVGPAARGIALPGGGDGGGAVPVHALLRTGGQDL